MYNEKFSEFKEKFLNDPKVKSLMLELSNEFERGFKEEIIDQLDEEEVYESIDDLYSLSIRDMSLGLTLSVFEILLFKKE